MKYFKPDILKRFRSREREVVESAAREWDAAVEAYHADLEAMKPLMPNTLRKTIRDMPALHDSYPLGLKHITPGGSISLLVRLEGNGKKPGAEIEIVYSAVTGDPNEDIEATQHDVGSKGGVVSILHHELDAEGEGVFSHSLLFSDGWVLKFRMRNMLVRTVKTLEPAPVFKKREPLVAFA